MNAIFRPGIDVHFEEHDAYLYAYVTGPKDDVNVSKSFWWQIRERVLKAGKRRVLVEENFSNQISTLEMFEVAEFVALLFNNKKDYLIAHVDQHEANMDLNLLGQQVASSKGLDVRVFNNREIALKWLLLDWAEEAAALEAERQAQAEAEAKARPRPAKRKKRDEIIF